MAKRKWARSYAARIIATVLSQRQSLTTVLTKTLTDLPKDEHSLCKQLCYGVIRWHIALQAIINQLLHTPLKTKDADISALLLCGIYQLRSMRISDHAALYETVAACQALNKPWATQLINACLRRYQRDKSALESSISLKETTHYAHPAWLVNALKKAWPQSWQTILCANNQPPPMILRVNQQRNSQKDYLIALKKHHIGARLIPQVPQGILLDTPCDVLQLPNFASGHVSVQDGASQLVINLLDIQHGQRILDACAAPGGKTCHILETEPDNTVIALDIDSQRLQQVRENINRLRLNATLMVADSCQPNDWWDGQKFDRILLDAPCSGTGVIRRHPDIKILRQAKDIVMLVKKQRQLLENLWPLLKTGGLLVYTTCSVLKQENEQQIMNFLQKHPDAQERPIPVPLATRTSLGYQRLPGDNELDGFYYACLCQR